MGERQDEVGSRSWPRGSGGVALALLGILAGFLLGQLAVVLYASLSGHAGHPSGFGADVAGLIGLWVGFLGAVAIGSARRGGNRPVRARLSDDYGLAIRLWPDVPLGIAVGVGAQYLLVPLLELPLLPFVPDLFTRLSQPAQQLTGDVHGAGLVVLGLLVCLGSPVVEELFFRGLLLRSLAGELVGRVRAGVPAALGLTGVIFGLVHFEPLQFLGLAGFGVVLAVLAWRFGRLGPGIIAHVAFNTVTIVALASAH